MWFINAMQIWILLAGVLTFVYWYIRNQFSFWAKLGVPYIKPHWFFGNFGDFINAKTSSAELTVKFYKEFKYKGFGGIWRFFSPILFVTDTELIRYILVKDYERWPTRGLSFNSDVDPLSATLVNLDDEKWKVMRTKSTPNFTPGKLKQMYHLLLESSKDFEKYLDALVADGGLVEARDMGTRLITDLIGSSSLGIQMNSFSDDNTLFKKLRNQIYKPTLQKNIVYLMQMDFPRLFKLLKFTTCPRETTDFFLEMMKQNFEYRKNYNVHRHDFTDFLMDLKNTGKSIGETKVEFDDKLLAAQAFDLFLGGFESGSATISNCLHELAVNEDIQNRLRKEVHGTKAANNGEITWDGLNSMKYLHMVIQETLRKYPSIPFLDRKSSKRYRIPGTNVELPSGLRCLIPVYAIHHDPEFYPDPEKFYPERFTHEAKSQRPAFTYLPFGKGPRNCIGLRLGEIQVKVAIIKLIDNYKFYLCEKSQHTLQPDPNFINLFPADGIWIRMARNSCE